MSKIENWIKRIPEYKQSQFEGLGRFKISLNQCSNKTQVKKSKQHLDLFFEKYILLDNIINKSQAQIKLKLSLKEYLYSINNKNLDIHNINNKIDKELNKYTIINLLDDEIVKRQRKYQSELKQKEKAGIDINIKRDKTEDAYKTIKKHFINYKKLNQKDIKDLEIEDFENFRYWLEEDGSSLNSIISWYKYLKAIFNRAKKAKKVLDNPVDVPGASKYENDDKTIFTYEDTKIINEKLENEEMKIILNLLLTSGMRLEELCSLKKSNFKNGVFVFFDSKDGFKKAVPVHKNYLGAVKDFIKNMKNEEYIFLKNRNTNNRVNNVRSDVMKELRKIGVNKTLHKTRTTFISYVNYYNQDFNDKDIKSITHKLSGNDDNFYVATRNIKNKEKIINNIDFKKLEEIENAMLSYS